MSRFFEREDDLENELNKNALWSVTYGDLMSYLMIFFLLMFAFSYSKNMKQQMSMLSIQETAGAKKAAGFQQLFSKYGVQQIAHVELTEEKLKITFLDPVLFDSGTGDLKPACLPALHIIAKLLREIPNAVLIEGHTDNIPTHGRYASNWELSTARANSVLKYLLVQEQLAPARFSALGHGEYRPVVANDTPEHRAQNRRIEITVLRLE